MPGYRLVRYRSKLALIGTKAGIWQMQPDYRHHEQRGNTFFQCFHSSSSFQLSDIHIVSKPARDLSIWQEIWY
jgi:hypothetical protein